MSATERIVLPVSLSNFIPDYSSRSIWWATSILVGAVAFVITFVYLRFRSCSHLLWNLPGSSCSSIFVALAIFRCIRENSKACYNVVSFQAMCGVAHLFNSQRMLRFWFGMKPVVMFFKPENVEVVLSSNALLDKTFVYDFLAPWFKEGLITSSGMKWKKRRKLLTPAFHFRILDDFLPVIEDHALFLAQKMRTEIGNKSFDLVPYITLCSLDILCETAMGKYVGAQKTDSPYVKALNEASQNFATRLMQPWLWPEFIFKKCPYGRRFKECTDIMDDFTRGVIWERKASVMQQMKGGLNMEDAFKNDDFGKRRRKAFLDLLLYEHMTDPCFTEEDITEEVNTFMFAGHDTTAVGMSWALYLIGLYPDVQKKILQEQEEIFGDEFDRPFTVDDLKNLKYLECVLKESQRLYPSLPYIGRESSSDILVNGYTIPSGTTCMIFTFMLHRNEEVFPDAEKFDPDRFPSRKFRGETSLCLRSIFCWSKELHRSEVCHYGAENRPYPCVAEFPFAIFGYSGQITPDCRDGVKISKRNPTKDHSKNQRRKEP